MMTYLAEAEDSIAQLCLNGGAFTLLAFIVYQFTTKVIPKYIDAMAEITNDFRNEIRAIRGEHKDERLIDRERFNQALNSVTDRQVQAIDRNTSATQHLTSTFKECCVNAPKA